jgi:valyl-tRNA synthetase
LDKDTLDFINTNEVILKKLGRINKFHEENLDKPSAAMVISGEIFKVYFDGDVDLKLIKTNLIKDKKNIKKNLMAYLRDYLTKVSLTELQKILLIKKKLIIII